VSHTRFNVVHPEADCIHGFGSGEFVSVLGSEAFVSIRRIGSEAFVSVQDLREQVHWYLVAGDAKMP